MAPLGSPFVLVLPFTALPSHSMSALSSLSPKPTPNPSDSPDPSTGPNLGGLFPETEVVSPAQPGTSPEDARPTKNKPSPSVTSWPHTLVFSHLPSPTLPGHLAFTAVSDHPAPFPGQEQALLTPPETLLPRSSQGWLCPSVPSPEKPSWVPPALKSHWPPSSVSIATLITACNDLCIYLEAVSPTRTSPL